MLDNDGLLGLSVPTEFPVSRVTFPGISRSRIPGNLADFSFPGNFYTMNFDKLTKKLSSNESGFMRNFLVEIR